MQVDFIFPGSAGMARKRGSGVPDAGTRNNEHGAPRFDTKYGAVFQLYNPISGIHPCALYIWVTDLGCRCSLRQRQTKTGHGAL